jgi:NAD-dependent dihydropyrimidine dehydrogenase PreA subunit
MKNFKKNLPKFILQFGVLVVIILFLTKAFGDSTSDPEAYCPFGGLQTLGSYLVNGSMACSMTMVQIMMGIVLAISIILFSKLFCGYLCPVGFVAEWMGKLRRKLKVKEIRINSGSITDILLRFIKYGLLFVVFYMTLESSELFCKNFDPYYAAATGFKGEITAWMVIASMSILFLGSFFINMFWCKYICPLGALSHIFKFTLTFIALVLAFYLLNIFGVSLSWKWLLGATVLFGYISEVVFKESKFFPFLKIHKDNDTCTSCGICSVKCPYNIDVANMDVVKDVDCTLCGDCIPHCKPGSLTVGKRKSFRWLPLALTIILFVLALYLGKIWELPTIDIKWGDEAKQENLSVMEVDGLYSVHCYGASMGFAAHLKRIDGVYGVATFVTHHKAKVYYQPDETNPDKIKEAIYIPDKIQIKTPGQDVEKLKVITIYTEHMYDRLDAGYLAQKFITTGDDYYGIETEYACPLIVRVYMGLNEPIDENKIEDLVEEENLRSEEPNGYVNIAETHFSFEGISDQIDTISRHDFVVGQFNPVKQKFEKNMTEYQDSQIDSLEFVYPTLNEYYVSSYLFYLNNYLSLGEGILGFETYLDENDNTCIKILYADGITNEEKIREYLKSPKWMIDYGNGEPVETDAKILF